MSILRHFSLYAFFLFAAVYSLTSLQMDRFADDPGVGWHLATANWIIDHDTVPRSDPFLAAPMTNGVPTTRRWIADQWLSDLILSALYGRGGFPLLYAFLTVIYLTTFFGILYLNLRSLSGAGFAALCATLFAFKISQLHFILRPVQFAFLLFCILCCFLWKLDRKLPSSLGTWGKYTFFLIILFLLWANLHPSFVLGFVLFALLIVAKCAENFLGWTSESHPPIVRLLLIFLLLLLSTLVNPYGAHLHSSILSLAQSDFFMNYHQEWQAPRMNEFVGILLQLLLGSLFLLPLLARQIPSGWTVFQILSVFVFARFALDAIRMAPFFGIVSALPVIYAWRSTAPLFDRAKGVFARLAVVFSRLGRWEFAEVRGRVLLPVLASALIWFSLPNWQSPRVGFRSGPFGPSLDRYPSEAVSWLRTNTEGAVVFAPANLGGFLIYSGDGLIQPIIDDRNELLGEGWYKAFEKAILDEKAFLDMARETSASYVLWPKQSASFPIFDRRAGLRRMYEDSQFVVWKIDGTLHG
jgi:hypothetical protein